MDHVTLKTALCKDAETSAFHHRNKYILKYIQIENNYFK